MYEQGLSDLWRIEYSYKKHRRDIKGSTKLLGRGAEYRVVVAKSRGYSRRWTERIVGCQLIIIVYLCINRPVHCS